MTKLGNGRIVDCKFVEEVLSPIHLKVNQADDGTYMICIDHTVPLAVAMEDGRKMVDDETLENAYYMTLRRLDIDGLFIAAYNWAMLAVLGEHVISDSYEHLIYVWLNSCKDYEQTRA